MMPPDFNLRCTTRHNRLRLRRTSQFKAPLTLIIRAYAFTINNYTDEDVALSKALNYTYIILGNEKGDEGTPHIQGFVYHKTQLYGAIFD